MFPSRSAPWLVAGLLAPALAGRCMDRSAEPFAARRRTRPPRRSRLTPTATQSSPGSALRRGATPGSRARARASDGTLSAVQTPRPRPGRTRPSPRSRSTPTATRSSPGSGPTGRTPDPGAGALRRRHPEHRPDPLRSRAGRRSAAPGRGRRRRRRRVHLATSLRTDRKLPGARPGRARPPAALSAVQTLSAAGQSAFGDRAPGRGRRRRATRYSPGTRYGRVRHGRVQARARAQPPAP